MLSKHPRPAISPTDCQNVRNGLDREMIFRTWTRKVKNDEAQVCWCFLDRTGAMTSGSAFICTLHIGVNTPWKTAATAFYEETKRTLETHIMLWCPPAAFDGLYDDQV